MVRWSPRAGLLVALLVLASAAPAWAAEPADPAAAMARLRTFLGNVQTLRATFRQEIVAGDGGLVQASRGKVVLKRPGRCRWDYEEPFQRVVVADGKDLWLYEADLEQVTVRPLRAGLGETPAGLLTGAPDMLDRFEVLDSFVNDGLSWVKLKPKSADSDFDSVAIGFAGDKPVKLELNDRLGQQTRVTFSDIELNRAMTDKVFRFEVPAGVDVIREGQP